MKIRHLLISFLLSVLFAMPVLADEGFYIQKFNTDINISQDSNVTATENINVFFTQNKHGIFRDIQTGGVKIKIVEVADENGEKYKYDKEQYSSGTRLKIGDPNAYVSGSQIYKIIYSTNKAIRFFDDHDELYWNVTGNASSVKINQATANVTLPQSISADKLQFKCYTGSSYSTDQDCTYQYNPQESKIIFKTNNALAAYHGFTIVVGVPKGILIKPTDIADYWWFKIIMGLVIVLSVMIALEPIYSFWKKGRDPKGRGSIMPEYEAPDNLCPAEVGTLVDEKAHIHDLTSTIVDLAVRGYLIIKVLKKAKGLIFKKDDYELIKVTNPQPKGKRKELTNFEKSFMSSVFGSANSKKISDLENKFYTKLPDLKDKIYNNLVKKEYFPQSPNAVRNKYFLKGGIIIFLAFFTPFAGFIIEPILDNEVVGDMMLFLAMGIILNGILSLIFANFMPAKTKKGVLARESILGLKYYMEIAEKDRLKFQEKENIFYELLPYAMALQIADKWSKAFKDILKEPPEWYEGHYASGFYISDFNNSINSMSSTMSTAFSSHPSSSSSSSSGFSGGFSGGGFGGGGVGSW